MNEIIERARVKIPKTEINAVKYELDGKRGLISATLRGAWNWKIDTLSSGCGEYSSVGANCLDCIWRGISEPNSTEIGTTWGNARDINGE